MSRLGLLLVAFCVWTGLALALGWTLRDGSARLQLQRQQTAQAQAGNLVLHRATQQTLANARAGAVTEQQRLDHKALRDRHFADLQQDITRHDQHLHALGRDRGDADPEFMRIWRAANAGHSGFGEPVDRSGTAAATTPLAAARTR